MKRGPLYGHDRHSGSGNPAHIQKNHDIYGFTLTDEKMAKTASLDRNEKHDWY